MPGPDLMPPPPDDGDKKTGRHLTVWPGLLLFMNNHTQSKNTLTNL